MALAVIEVSERNERRAEIRMDVPEPVCRAELLGMNETLLEQRQCARRIVLDEVDKCEVVQRRGDRAGVAELAGGR